ncbi:MAG: endolytic transglycosylase MltG [Cyanobacteria bacterium P01_D01_bin.123]
MAGKRLWVGLLAIVVLGAGGASWFGWKQWQQWLAPVEGASQTRIEVATGSSVRAIGHQLAQEGLIHSPLAWELWFRFAQDVPAPQAGVYDIDPSGGLPDIAAQLGSGQIVQETFTIPEGWRIKQMAEYFETEVGWFSADEFIAETERTQRPEFPWLPAGLPLLEGFLFPSTYQLSLEARNPKAVVDTMLRQFEQTALPLYEANRTSSNPTELSLLEWTALASIVEKESVQPQERGRIAGVFANRLRLGMLLGADPTVEYAFDITQTPDRPLTFAEVEQPSPYNTYVTPGLPPTAIASPGLASLEAALNPEPTQDLYFVARYDGSHVFSRTLTEHNAAQRRIHNERRVTQ